MTTTGLFLQASDWEKYSQRLSLKQEEALAAVRSVVTGGSGTEETIAESDKGGAHSKEAEISPVKEHTGDRLDAMERLTVDGIVSIHTRSEFYTWYSELEATRASEAEATYKRHADMVEERINACNDMLKSIEKVVEIFNGLKASQRTISSRTDALKEQCDTLVSERDKLSKVSDMVKERLDHFNRLETLSSLFHAPVSASSDPQSILKGLEDLDTSLEFTRKHPEYLESAKYHAKFQHLQTRALSMVKSYFEESISRAVAECKMAGKVIASEDDETVGNAEMTMQNVKFRAVAEPRLKELMAGVCQHGQSSSSYQQLLKDCSTMYCKSRFELIRYTMFSQIQKCSEEKVIDGLKQGSEIVSQTAEMEIQLYQQIFNGISMDQMSSQLESLFDSMCILLTAVIEPMVYGQIANDLDALAGLNAYLNNLMQGKSRGCIFNVPSLQKFVESIEKMIFRQAKMECANLSHNAAAAMLLDEQGMGFLKSIKPPLDISACKCQCAVDFPPVSHVIGTLQKLYPSVIHKDIFVEFIREVVNDAFASIDTGSERLAESMGEAHGAIFKLRQLSLIMDCLDGFGDVKFSESKKPNGRSLTQLGRQISTKIPILSSFTNRTAHVQVNTDTRLDVQKKLTVSREFCILTCSQDITNPLLSFLTKVTAAKVSTQSNDIKSHAFASVERVSHLSKAVRDAIQGPLSQHIALIYMVMPEKERDVVMKTIRENLTDALRQLENIVRDEYSDEEQKEIALPSVDETAALLQWLVD